MLKCPHISAFKIFTEKNVLKYFIRMLKYIFYAYEQLNASFACIFEKFEISNAMVGYRQVSRNYKSGPKMI